MLVLDGGDHVTAIALCRRALEEDGDDVMVWCYLGRIQLQLGDYASAVQTFVHVERMAKPEEQVDVQLNK